MPKELGKSALQRRTHILDAAQDLFIHTGLRATTMQAIAHTAKVAKPTLYGYFPSKHVLFDAVIARLIAKLRTTCETALATNEPAIQRAANALAAKHKLVYRLLEGSNHADELHAAGRGTVFEAFEKWLLTAIVDTLAQDDIAEPVHFAALLIACADGIANHAHQAAEIGPAIRHVAQKLSLPG